MAVIDLPLGELRTHQGRNPRPADVDACSDEALAELADLGSDVSLEATFFGAINSQQTLPYGTPEQVRAEVRERIRVLGRGGGYICGPDHTVMADVPIENVFALIDEARRTRP